MNIEVDWDKVLDLEYNIEGDGIYSISIIFNNGDALTYGYISQKRFLKDCSYIAEKRAYGSNN